MDAHKESPRLLAIESATETLSVALLSADAAPIEATASSGGRHAEHILPLVAEVLAGAGIGLADVDAFGVSIGPGSFTSLRVGLASVKGLAFGTDRPTVPVSTLAALAWTMKGVAEARPLQEQAQEQPQQEPARAIAALLDARRGELYAGIYRLADAGPVELLAPGLYAPEQLAQELPAGALLIGEGAEVYARELLASAPPGVALVSQRAVPRAGAVAALALQMLARGHHDSAADLAPLYVRRAEAEVKRTSQQVESSH